MSVYVFVWEENTLQDRVRLLFSVDLFLCRHVVILSNPITRTPAALFVPAIKRIDSVIGSCTL